MAKSSDSTYAGGGVPNKQDLAKPTLGRATFLTSPKRSISTNTL